ncbi:hypothetical protein JCM8547_003514 [Rhodosporidiobolus lusitaniae]
MAGMLDPRNLMLQPQEDDFDDLGDGKTYIVDRLLDYRIWDNLVEGKPLEEWEPQGQCFQVRFLVKWGGYDKDSDNTWEPNSNFKPWTTEYDRMVEEIKKKKGRKSRRALEDECESKNEKYRRDLKEEDERARKDAKRLTGAAHLTGRAKGKGKEVKKKDIAMGKEKATEKSKEKEKAREKKPLMKPRVSATSSNSSLNAPKKGRSTRNSGDALWDDHFNESFIETGNASREIRALRRTPTPQHDEHGNLIQSPSSNSSTSPQMPGVTLSHFDYPQQQRVQEQYLQQQQQQQYAYGPYAAQHGYGYVPQAVAYNPHDAYAAAQQAFSQQQQQQPVAPPPPPPAPTGADESGFAGSSDVEEDEREEYGGGYEAPPLDTGDGMSLDLSASMRGGEVGGEPLAGPLGPSGDDGDKRGGGFAGTNDEEQDEPKVEAADPAAGGFADSSDVDDEPLAAVDASTAPPVTADVSGFADDEDEDEPAAVPAASHPADASRFAADEDEPDVVPAPAAPPAGADVSGFAADDSSEGNFALQQGEAEDAKMEDIGGEDEHGGVHGGGFAGESGEDEEGGEEETAHRPPRKMSSSPGDFGPLPQPPMKKRKVEESRLRLSSRRGVKKVIKIKPMGLKASKLPSRPPPAPAPIQESRPNAPPPKKKAKRIVDSSSEGELGEPARAPQQKQQPRTLADLKFGKKKEQQPFEPALETLKPFSAVSTSSAPLEPPASSASPSAASPSISTGVRSRTRASQPKKAYDPFNQGIERPASTNGYIILRHDALVQKRLSITFVNNREPRWKVVTELDKVHSLFGIASRDGARVSNQRILDGSYELDDLLLDDGNGRAREVYMTEPPTETQTGRDKVARRAVNDYRALQLVLSGLQGVKQADSPRKSVTAVFVHVNKMAEVGKFPGKLSQLEDFRKRDEVVFFTFGEVVEGQKRILRRFWRSCITFTFTPSALILYHDRYSALIERQVGVLAARRGFRDRSPWIPLQYVLPGGEFGPSMDEEGKAVQPEKIKEPNNAWEQVSQWYPLNRRETSVEALQQVVCEWRTQYQQVRRWIIIATPEELQRCPAAPGVDLVSLEQAEEILAC